MLACVCPKTITTRSYPLIKQKGSSLAVNVTKVSLSIQPYSLKVLTYPFCSPGLATQEFHLFGSTKAYMAEERFTEDTGLLKKKLIGLNR